MTKIWTNRLPAAANVEADFERLIAGDRTDSSQANALRDWLFELQTAGVTAPWFEWNGTDLSQFDARVDGSNATGTTAVISFRGENWIQFRNVMTFDAQWSRQISILPITKVPPTPNYRIEAEVYLVTANAGWMGTGFSLRWNGAGSYMYLAAAGVAVRHGELFQHLSMVDTPSTILAPAALAIPDLAVGRSTKGEAGVRGIDPSGVWLQRRQPGPFLAEDDTSSPHVTAGQAGLLMTGAASAAGTIESYFRDIKCFSI